MKINFDAVLTGLEGQPLLDDTKQPVTLKALSLGALMSVFVGEENLTGEEKLSRYQLASTIHRGSIVDLKVEDIAKIKFLIGKAYGVLAVGKAYELLDS